METRKTVVNNTVILVGGNEHKKVIDLKDVNHDTHELLQKYFTVDEPRLSLKVVIGRDKSVEWREDFEGIVNDYGKSLLENATLTT